MTKMILNIAKMCALSEQQIKNIARIANAVPVTLYSRVTMNVLRLLFSIVRNVNSVSQVTRIGL